MCGIAGILQHEPDDAAARLAIMLRAMHHRGPDGEGALTFSNGAAGMTRLALVDLSTAGQQPLYSPDGNVAILFNGEIYNFREHRAALASEGYPFRSKTDTETILALYLKHGLAFATKLRGMFAIAIIDFRARGRAQAPAVHFVRGPLGVKPLYIATPRGAAGPIVFASEIKALLASGLVAPEVDGAAVGDFLAHGFVLQPRTIIRGVRMVAPGAIETFDAVGGHTTQRPFTLPPYEPRTESLAEAAHRLRACVEESVALHAFADAPVGAFLSGGVDSAAIAALMRPHVSKLRTYTLRFPGTPVADEAKHAEAFAQQLACEHTTVDVTGDEIARVLPAFARDLDQPSVDGLNTWLISRAAATGVKGVLSGLGGDEFFAGYPVTARMVRSIRGRRGRLMSMAGLGAHTVEPFLPRGALRTRVANLAARRSMLAVWAQAHRCFSWEEAAALLGVESQRDDGVERIVAAIPYATDLGRETPVGLSTILDVTIYMMSQLLRDSDATSMAHSLELRVPFVDREIVAFSRSCDDEYKLKAGRGDSYEASGAKRVLIEAVRDILPSDIMQRPKRGFALPFDAWMRGPLSALARDAIAPSTLRARGLVDPSAWVRLRDSSADRSADFWWPKAWALMILEEWCRGTLDASSVRPSGEGVRRVHRATAAVAA